jgi:TolA-binding protein
VYLQRQAVEKVRRYACYCNCGATARVSTQEASREVTSLTQAVCSSLVLLGLLMVPAVAQTQRSAPSGYTEDRLNQLQQTLSELTRRLQELQKQNQQLQQHMEKMQASFEQRVDRLEKASATKPPAPAARPKPPVKP